MKKEKKTALDLFLEESLKNAPTFEGYTIQELREKMDESDYTCPTCGKPFGNIPSPKRSKIYELKKKK